MSGTKEGGIKARETIRGKYPQFYQRIGGIGGKAKVPKGFAIDRRTWWEKLLRKPKLAKSAGKLGGKISKRH